MLVAACRLTFVAAVSLALCPVTAQAAGWVPGPAVPISAPESALAMQTDAGADGTAAAVWSDGTTVRAAVKPAGSATFGAPVPIGSGQTPDVAVSPGGRVLAVWVANDGLHASERPAGSPGFADLGVILAKPGTSDPQVAFFADGRAAAKTIYTGGFAGLIRQAGADSFVHTDFEPAATFNGSDMAVSDQTGELVIPVATKSGITSQILLARIPSTGPAVANAFDTQTDTSSFPNSTTYFHLTPRVVADDRIVVTYITEKDVSALIPTSQTTTLRSLVRPAAGPPQLGDIDLASNSGFFGPRLNNPSLIRRSDGTVTAAWVDTDLGVASLRLSTANLPPLATLFMARDDVEGFGGTFGAIVGTTEMAELPSGASGLVASEGTAVRAATSSSGQPFGAPIDLVTGADTPSSARLAGDGLGGLLATWTQADGTNRRTFARLYDDAPPTLSNATAPAALNAGQTGQFSAAASDTWTGATPVWDFGDGQTTTGTQVSHSFASGGQFTVSVRARDAAGNVSEKTERVVSVTGPPAGGGPGPGGGPAPGGTPADKTAPVISGLSLVRKTFAVAAAKRKIVVKRGTTVRFRLSEPAALTMTFSRTIRGFRSGGRCVTKKPAGKKASRCTIQRRIGSVKANGKSGANSVPFKGRVSGRPLAAGSYRLTLAAVDPAGNRSKQVTTSFKIVRAR
jgi:hypothetical protein